MVNIDEIRSLMAACAQAARLGGEELIRRLRDERRVEQKGSYIDLVTDADRASEEKIVAFVESHYPDHAILAEERGSSKGTAPFRWIIDPLDGTTNYAHGVPHFCVSIAVEDGKGSLAAAVLDVSRNELFQAGRGLGATLNGSRIEVSREGTLARALLATGFPYDIWTAPERPLGLLDIFIRRCQGIRRAGSAALDLCWVACGRYDGFFEVKLKPWDLAGGTLVVREAGGEVGDLMGGPVDYSVCDVLASNGRLHRDMVELARQVPPHGR